MNRLTREIEEIESKLEAYGTIQARITIWGSSAEEVKETTKELKLRVFSLKKNHEEEVVTADYICKRNKNIIITIRG